MEISNIDIYKKELIKTIISNMSCYTGYDLTRLEGSSIIDLEQELREITGKGYKELSGNTVLI